MSEYEICPFRIGSRVRVNSKSIWTQDWPGVYVVTGMRWEYRNGDGSKINLSIASDGEIEHRYGDADGFSPDDLTPA